MAGYHAMLRTLLTMLAYTVLVAAAGVGMAAAQKVPLVGPPAVPMEENPVLPADHSPIVATAATFGANGGVDMPLGGANEPAIAVNPTDPHNIAMASLHELRVSTDNGATFSTPTPCPIAATYLRVCRSLPCLYQPGASLLDVRRRAVGRRRQPHGL